MDDDIPLPADSPDGRECLVLALAKLQAAADNLRGSLDGGSQSEWAPRALRLALQAAAEIAEVLAR